MILCLKMQSCVNLMCPRTFQISTWHLEEPPTRVQPSMTHHTPSTDGRALPSVPPPAWTLTLGGLSISAACCTSGESTYLPMFRPSSVNTFHQWHQLRGMGGYRPQDSQTFFIDSIYILFKCYGLHDSFEILWNITINFCCFSSVM